MKTFKQLALLTLCLTFITSCTQVKRTNFKKLDYKDIYPIVKNVDTNSGEVWEKFIFDIEVISGGKAMIQANASPNNRRLNLATHVLIMGHWRMSNKDSIEVGANTGLWLNKQMNKEQARLQIGISWPSSLGDEPEHLLNSKVSAEIYCEEWAQGLIAADSKSINYKRLARSLDKSLNKNMFATTPLAPYKVSNHWIVPIEIRLEKSDFKSNCLNR